MSATGKSDTPMPHSLILTSWRFLAPLWVLPEYQKRGVATLLMNDVLDSADAQDPPIPVYLEALPDARPVYEHMGFVGFEGQPVQMIRRGPKDVRKLAE
jgi:GNAT superfamily N-acetyltransferase